MNAESDQDRAGGHLGRQGRRHRAARLRQAHAAAHCADRRGRPRIPARPRQGAGAAGRRRPATGGRPHRRGGGRTRAADGDHLRGRARAGPRRLAPRQPASRHRDRRAYDPYPRRPRHRRHGARARRRGARSWSGRSIRKAAPTATARCRATAMGTLMAITTTSIDRDAGEQDHNVIPAKAGTQVTWPGGFGQLHGFPPTRE